MTAENMIMLCTSIVYAGGLAGGMAPELAQADALQFVATLAQEIEAAEEGPDYDQIRRETRP